MTQRLLVSVRGKNDTHAAVLGGAHIIDAEYPGSALGTCYPLNIYSIRQHTPLDRLVATNIGEKQFVWSTAAQAAVGSAFAGADIIKVGLAGLKAFHAKTVMKNVTHQVRYWFPWKILITTLFADDDLREILDPVTEGAQISVKAKSQGVLIDTFDKDCGKGILDYLSLKEITAFVHECHTYDQEAWIAGSITLDQMHSLWRTGVDVICIRGAVCETSSGRGGRVSSKKVESFVRTVATGEGPKTKG